jgi:hypothetical protein
MIYQIKINGENLTIQLESQSFETEITAFLAIRKHSDNCSDNFLHLAERDLDIPLDFFYELAKKINQLLPNHKINWSETFYNVSKELYNSALTIKVGEFEGDSENCTDALDDDEVEIELSDLKTRKAFLDGVNDRLISEGIITKYRFDN